MKYMATYVWPTLSNTRRCSVRPACEGSYGRIRLLPYGAAVGLWGLIWSHAAPSPMAPQPACGGSYGRIRSLPLLPRPACGALYGRIRLHTDTYGCAWSPMCMATYVCSDFASYSYGHIRTHGPIWMSMVTYGFSDFRRQLMVANGYIRTHMNVYGRLCVP